MNNVPVLKINNLSKTYIDQSSQESTILEDVNIEIDEKEFICILGPSGCGKTTFLRCIAGFEDFSGHILVDGNEAHTPGTDRIMVFQDFNQLFPWKTVEHNIISPLKLSGIKDSETAKSIAHEALKKVKLADYAKYYPFQLSGGMKQRVAIAKALALKPKIVLMDEPFAALDAITRRDLQNELLKIADQETCTFIFVTHNIQEAIILGKRILVMGEHGKIVLDQKNELPRPVTPATPGYGEFWQQLKDSLY